MKFNGGRQFGHSALMIFCRIRLLIWCNQLCRIEHVDLAMSLGFDSRRLYFESQGISIERPNTGISNLGCLFQSQVAIPLVHKLWIDAVFSTDFRHWK